MSTSKEELRHAAEYVREHTPEQIDDQERNWMSDYEQSAGILATHVLATLDPWVAVEDRLGPVHQDVICLNRDGRIFRGRMCYGMHEPFWTYPQGDKDRSDTCPAWIDVTHWMHILPPPETKR